MAESTGRKLTQEKINDLLLRKKVDFETLMTNVFNHPLAQERLIRGIDTKEVREKNTTTLIDILGDTFGGSMQDRIHTYAYINTDLIRSGNAVVVSGIKKQYNLPVGKANFKFQATAAKLTPSGSAAEIRQRPLVPNKYSLFEEYDFSVFDETFFSLLQSGRRKSYFNPPEIVRAWLIMEMLGWIKSTHESLYLRGSAKTPNVPASITYLGFEQIIETGDGTDQARKFATPSLAFTASGAGASAGETRLTLASTANLKAGDLITLLSIADTAVNTNLAGAIYNNGNVRAQLDLEDVRLTSDYIQITNIISATQIDINVAFANANTFDSENTSGRIAFINASNVVDTFSKAWNAIPTEVRTKPGFKLWINTNIYNQLTLTEAARLGNTFQTDAQGKQYFLGIPFYVNDYVSPNTIIGCVGDENMHIGFMEQSEIERIDIIDKSVTTGEYVYLFRANFGSGVQVLKFNEIVFVRPV